MTTRRPKTRPVASTAFSEFIRNASVEEKERVYAQVIRNATERQNGSVGKKMAKKPRV